jgi:hypothetical protein
LDLTTNRRTRPSTGIFPPYARNTPRSMMAINKVPPKLKQTSLTATRRRVCGTAHVVPPARPVKMAQTHPRLFSTPPTDPIGISSATTATTNVLFPLRPGGVKVARKSVAPDRHSGRKYFPVHVSVKDCLTTTQVESIP